ncbi:MAG: pilus assembly protein N-terminal domain-containing protein [Alphaproteobacteria bacterium]
MLGRLHSRLIPALMLTAFAALTLPSDAGAQSWKLEREQGVGGGPGEVAAAAEQEDAADKQVGVSIVIETADRPVVREAEGVPVSPFAPVAEEQAAPSDPDPKAVAAVTQDETAATAALHALIRNVNRNRNQSEPARPASAASTIRSAPPTAAELLGAPVRPIETTAVAALTVGETEAELAARAGVRADQAPAPIEQAQFSPNAGAQPKTILPTRTQEAPAAGAAAAVILPSPRKPVSQAEAGVQQVLLSPGVGAAPKESVLRTAPTPDNALVELVETPTDYSLSLAAGKAQVLNLGKPVTNVFVADPNVADVNVLSPTQIVVHGNQLGRTNIFGISERGEVIFAVDVDTVPNADVAAAQLHAAAPASATDVSLKSGTLIAEGGVADVQEAIEVANVVDGLQQTQGPTANNTTIAGSQQVNLRVRFAEVSRNDVFNLGINWDALVDADDFLFGLSTGNFLAAAGDGLLARDLSVNGEEFGRLDFNGDFGDVSVDAFIDALQREGIVNVLAEPNLTSVNGEPANFLAGGEIPILVPGGAGGDTVTIDYKPFGVSLDFIPTLLPGDRINLRVRPEVSTISNNGAVVLDGFAVPAFTVRRAETSVELGSGQTFAIAGLFQRDLTTDTDKFPILGDVPVLGQLFQSERFRRSETELVILITPYLVKPISANGNIVLPNDRLDQPIKPLAKQDRKRAGFIVN